MDLIKYEKASEIDIRVAINNAINQVYHCLPDFTDKFKVDTSVNNFYQPGENISWTTGFWTGEIWLAYEHTEDDELKEAALKHVNSFYHRIINQIEVEHHDMGFLYSPSCVAAYKLVASEKAKEAALLAADTLIKRYQPIGEFIQAWGVLGAPDNYRLIIDCLNNLPLLYWASYVTGDSKYETVAKKHIMTSLKHIVREDRSTYHTFYFDPITGGAVRGVTMQGNRDGSAWARGQAWGIYGIALSYYYTREKNYITMFKDVTDYFIEHLPNDLVPFWDFDFTDGSNEPRDSSSAAIAVCGMLEMSKYLDDEDSNYYKDIALKILKSLIDNYSVKDSKISNGQLLHGVYSKKSEFNPCVNNGVDECNTWGDYYYFEALTRVSKEWNMYW